MLSNNVIECLKEVKVAIDLDDYKPSTISKIFNVIHQNSEGISIENKKKLLKIPMLILNQNAISLNSSENDWQKNREGYFLGNLSNPYFSELRNDFKNENLDLNSMKNLLTSYLFDVKQASDYFALRNLEVTFRDDVEFNGNLDNGKIKGALPYLTEAITSMGNL